MKLQTIFFSILVGTLSIISCSENRLEESPVDQFPLESPLTSESDMLYLLNGVYDQYSTAAGFGTDILVFGDLISDNVFITSQNTDVAYRTTGFLNWSPDVSDFGMLDDLYDGIVLANAVINDQSLAETPTVLNYKGEARIARAIGYFYAVSFYSPNPTAGVNQEYGVPLNVGIYNPDNNLPRASVAEVYDLIISDLTSALSMMTSEVPLNKGHLSPTAARLLLSRVYLTRGAAGDYQKALDYANQVINSAGSNTFDFVSKTNYVNYFTSSDIAISENQPETVWEINMTSTPSENTSVNNSLSSFYASNGSKKRFLFTQNFYSSFPSTDVRRSLFTSSAVPTQDNPTGLWTRKYIRLTSEGNFTQNVKILRMSEAYLNKIEALNKLGNLTAALTELNSFATKRGGSTYTSASIENILTERRKEFFAEGQRFFDLKRNNLGFSKITNCYSSICDVPANSRLFIIPMPLREMNINPNMTQYPDWK
ncbi:RagB/SusD family nutrient uptake outer membrane protein [Chryseobacterium sp. SC28]|uniref:RagB/SusD family nutrient uptake outer membrane protein n=1 Tax=Chryseobacterium sp. SC28 TaxID=2268028 RepID=UPI000F648FB9|nr:RagB/SusD family nutrient uptake outer membrane protein [Chryseobacterium sp. SC28]RRQ47202.1 RagB/SusD family nutrient uptake outer membrane protein [Chryseobacterium sp. SC28]